MIAWKDCKPYMILDGIVHEKDELINGLNVYKVSLIDCVWQDSTMKAGITKHVNGYWMVLE